VLQSELLKYTRLARVLSKPTPVPPRATWRDGHAYRSYHEEQCVKAARLLRICREKGWRYAERRQVQWLAACLRELRNAVEDEERRLRDYRTRLDVEIEGVEPITRPKEQGFMEIIHDLAAIARDFDDFRFDLRAGTMSATTPPVTLEDNDGNEVDLGPFTITYWWKDDRYRVRAVSPRYCNDYFHPHVSVAGVLCEGEAEETIQKALAQRRYHSLFDIIYSTLCCYNSASPYVELENWGAEKCHDCGGFSHEAGDCQSCEEPLCGDCGSVCGECSDVFCGSCCTRCTMCHETTVCSDHSYRCRDCRDAGCDNCVQPCADCERRSCGECGTPCNDCGEVVCTSNCAIQCAECEEYFCRDHVADDDCEKCDKRKCHGCMGTQATCKECLDDDDNDNEEADAA
jgi:hypothetical protein